MPRSDKIILAFVIAFAFLTYLVGAFGKFDGTYAAILALFVVSCLWLRHTIRSGRPADMHDPTAWRTQALDDYSEATGASDPSDVKLTAAGYAALEEISGRLIAKLAEIPLGLDVTHSPDKVRAEREGRSGGKYTWTHSTTVIAKTEATILEFYALNWIGGNWIWKPGTNPFTRQDFSEWYGCPDGRLVPGQAYTDEGNWAGGDILWPDKRLWYYIAVTPEGRRIKGQAVVELLPELLSNQRSEHARKEAAEGGNYRLTHLIEFKNPWGGLNYKAYVVRAKMPDGMPTSLFLEAKYRDTEYSDAFTPGASVEAAAAALDKLLFELAFISENIRQARAGLMPDMAVLWIIGDHTGMTGDSFLSFVKCFVENAIRDGSHSTIRGVTNLRWFSEHFYFGKCPGYQPGTTMDFPNSVWRYRYEDGAFEEVPVASILKPMGIHSVLADQ